MAVEIRKLSTEEAARLFPKRGQMDLSQYKQDIQGLRPGDVAEVRVGDLSSRAVKRRVGQAAKQLGYSLRWAPEDDNAQVLHFQVREAPQQAPRNGRRGRRRKSETT